ncbi:MAG TPA: hypothetical protein VGD45_18975 [Steroidobacter sp.]|uniref:hypothetical protein n=1 Tax=Steroidobacter sp. TaxID=1978227 RepID=UPI002ED9D100
MDQITIWGSSLYRRPDTLATYQNETRRLLIALRAVSSSFLNLTAIGAARADAIPADLHTLGEIIEAHVLSRGTPDDYLETLSDGRVGTNSLSRIGFSLTYCTPGQDSPSILSPAEGGIALSVRGAAADPETAANVGLKLPSNEVAILHSRASIVRLLNTIVEIWQCNLGGVSLAGYQAAIKPRNLASYAGQWLYYLPFPHLSKCLPPDIHHEPFANGILIQTTPHMPDANNPADIEAGIRVRDVLDEFGLVNDATYAIEGWPPDQEETIYEQFISGAPANRKYTVHCINFDGYDSDRKVLLYAKLFRRLKRHPKEWGLRGWDGPVLNEAKRQVRAAAKAGGVPIEWHIGLKEPAHQVRQLLADYTTITEQQLRVIYTPLEEALNRSPPP